jgi:CMP-N-acetylneuraminic acid synthetase
MPSLAALVPMRHHSQRVPGKNYRPLAVVERRVSATIIQTVGSKGYDGMVIARRH